MIWGYPFFGNTHFEIQKKIGGLEDVFAVPFWGFLQVSRGSFGSVPFCVRFLKPRFSEQGIAMPTLNSKTAMFQFQEPSPSKQDPFADHHPISKVGNNQTTFHDVVLLLLCKIYPL